MQEQLFCLAARWKRPQDKAPMGSRITPWSRIPNAGPCRPAKTMMGAPITAQGYRCFPAGNCPYPSRPVLVNRRRTEVAPRNVCIPSLETGTGCFAFATRPIEAVCFVRNGNRRAVLLSRVLIASSMLFYCVLPSFAGFLTANLLLGGHQRGIPRPRPEKERSPGPRLDPLLGHAKPL